jgi:D-alanyl-D-alanine carboxypeptidase
LPPLAAAAVAPPQPQPAVQVRAAAPVPARVRSPAPVVLAATAQAVVTNPAHIPAPARGAPPSTFQQQAANLAGGAPQPAYYLSGPARTAPAAAVGVEIQIGAFSSVQEAERQLGLARSKAGDLIGAAPGAAQAASANGRAIWRARFGGFQSQQASNVCTELRRRQIDCLVVRAE